MDEHSNITPTSVTDAYGEVQVTETPQSVLEQALLAHWERRYADAKVLYQKALYLDPGLLSGRVWHAILLAQQGRPGEAGTELERALEINPSLTADRLEAAQHQEPNDDAILSLRGLLEIRRGDLTAARDGLNLALRLNPDNVGALAWMVQILVSEGDYAGAERYLSRAQVLAPEDASVKAAEQSIERSKLTGEAQRLLARAQAEASEGHLDVAENLFEQAMQLQPGDPAIRREYARFLVTNQRYPEAVEQFEAALTIDPDDVETRRTLDDVRATLERQREMNRLIEAGRESLQAGQWEEALRKAEATLAKVPDSAEAQALKTEVEAARLRDQIRRHLTEADRLMAEEDYEGATATLEEAQQLLPGDEEIQERLETVEEKWRTHQIVSRYLEEAQQKDLEGDSKGAFKLLEMARQLNPESPSVHKAHQRLVRRKEAQELLAEARTLAEREPTSALELVSQAQDLAPEIKGIKVVKTKVQAQIEAKHEVDEALRLASDQRSAGQLIGARETLLDTLKTHPDVPSLKEEWKDLQRELETQVEDLLSQGRAAKESGDPEKALELYGKAVNLIPEHAAAQDALTSLTHSLERQTQARELWQEAQRRYEAGEYEEAEQALRHALELTPEDETLQSTLRQWEQERVARDRVAEAVECQRQAKESEARRDYEQAATFWEEALRLQPDDDGIRRGYAAFAERQRRLKAEEEEAPPSVPPEPVPVEPPVSEPALADPDATIRRYAEQAVVDWQAGDMAECLAAAQQGYKLAGDATDARDLGLQCGLVWVGLTWASSADLSKAEKRELRQVAVDIARNDAPLRTDFSAHLLSHLTHATTINDRYPLENLALPSNTPDSQDRRLVGMVIRYGRLDDEARQELGDALMTRVTGDMGALILHTITELLGRRE